MATIISSLDQDLGWKLPWMVAQAAWGPNPAVYHKDIEAQVRAGQALLWKRGVALQGPLTDDLTGPPWRSGLQGRGIHFSDIGLHVHAERWYTHLMAEVFAPKSAVQLAVSDSRLAPGGSRHTRR
jgi:hypothetical protein